jgi:hypothetical protein
MSSSFAGDFNYNHYYCHCHPNQIYGGYIMAIGDQYLKRQESQSGWVCPLCQRVYGPSVVECYSCSNKAITNSESGATTEDKLFLERHESKTSPDLSRHPQGCDCFLCTH